MPSIKKAIEEAKRIANDNRHGYSQKNRNGKPDYDCSSLVIHCLDYGGFPMSSYGATYTGNMTNALIKCGFKNVIKDINIKTGKGMKAGDVFLNRYHHTAIAVSDTQLCAAHDNYDRKTGDSSGNEINIYKYKNYVHGWLSVWRYTGKQKENSLYSVADAVIKGKYGNGAKRISNLETAGYDPEKVQKIVNDILTYSDIAKEAISGKYGNGKDRKEKITAAGLPYDTIQSIINAYLKGEITL